MHLESAGVLAELTRADAETLLSYLDCDIEVNPTHQLLGTRNYLSQELAYTLGHLALFVPPGGDYDDLASRLAPQDSIHAEDDGDAFARDAEHREDADEERDRAAGHAGRSDGGPELQATVYLTMIQDSHGEVRSSRSSFSDLITDEPDVLAETPAVLSGTVDDCIEQLVGWRERLGISYWHLGPDIEAVAPIVAKLSGA